MERKANVGDKVKIVNVNPESIGEYEVGDVFVVTSTYDGDDDIGKLMHDFRCSDPDDMLDEQLAAKTKYYKETEEGVAIVCKAIEDMRNDTSVRTYVEACRDFGIVDQNEIVKKLLEKFKFLTEAQARKYVS